jgi:hypothetical protein
MRIEERAKIQEPRAKNQESRIENQLNRKDDPSILRIELGIWIFIFGT